MGGWFQVIIVPSTSFTLVLCLLTLDRTVCQILKFTSVYVGWQGCEAQQLFVMNKNIRIIWF